jgi:low affinity Fe/Cu permease
MENLVHSFTALMSRTSAFMVIGIAGIVFGSAGFIFGLGEGYSAVVNLAISIFTMITAQGIQVSGTRDTLAMHLKLDTIIKHLDIPDDEIGDEKETEDELSRRKEALENQCE